MSRITRLRSRQGGPTPLNQRSNARDKGVPEKTSPTRADFIKETSTYLHKTGMGDTPTGTN